MPALAVVWKRPTAGELPAINQTKRHGAVTQLREAQALWMGLLGERAGQELSTGIAVAT